MRHDWFTGRNMAYTVLVYYWIGRGVLGADLPAVFPPEFVSFLTAGSVGWLIRDYSGDVSEAVARSRSPRVMTMLGDFSWDGVTEVRNINGTQYSLFYGNGVNYDGFYERGDVAICVPTENVFEVGRNRLVVTEIKRGALPPGVIFNADVRAVLTGSFPSEVFHVKVNAELSTVRDELDAAISFGSMQWQLNQDIMNMIADGGNLMRTINPFVFVDGSTGARLPRSLKKVVEDYDDDDGD